MSGWNEDNFLEKAMPLLEKKLDAGICPDAPTLCGVADGMAPAAVRDAVDRHVAGCPACAELLQRLGRFHQTAAAGPEIEWNQTEQRLDNRMRQFVAEGRATSPWWKLSWVLIPVAALATLLIWIPRMKTPAPAAVARVETPSPAVVAQDKPAPGIATLSVSREKKEVPIVPAPAPALAPHAAPKPAETATAPPPPAVVADPVVEPAPSHSPSARFAPVVTTAGGQSAPPPPTTPATPSPAPTSVRLNAGTRVWILLQSTSRESNGGFTFRGMVLLPVTQGGAVLLDRETRVMGTGNVNQGRTTIRIAEFVWQGTRYRLRGVPVAVHAPAPGSGPAVEFNSGQVLETWLGSLSIYERVPGAPAPQG